METDFKLVLPIGELEHVIILEKKGADQSIMKQYWAPGYGKVKDEFIIVDENNDKHFITSELITIQ